jgi:hypothetical protein
LARLAPVAVVAFLAVDLAVDDAVRAAFFAPPDAFFAACLAVLVVDFVAVLATAQRSPSGGRRQTTGAATA